MNILIVLPYSGKQIGGGLAVLNEQLTAALVKNGHSVKLLTFKLAQHLSASTEGHAGAGIVALDHPAVARMGANKQALNDDERAALYDLINNPKTLEETGAVAKILDGKWEPDIIIGHSRFSGPAAVLLKEKHFRKAQVEYFLHSYPFEGSTLTGYEAYDEKIDVKLAAKKIEEESAWMVRADVVVAMGPLLALGALDIMQKAGARNIRVHEAIPGVETREKKLQFRDIRQDLNLLMVARFNAPIKGLEDVVLAARLLNERHAGRRPERRVRITVRGIGQREYSAYHDRSGAFHEARTINNVTVGKWVRGVLGHDADSLTKPDSFIYFDVRELTKDIEPEYMRSDAVLAPSYIEHFGLVPFEALSYGLPILANEISGSGLFLGDEDRFPRIGPPCVVKDFDRKPGPLRLDDILRPKADAFDKRPQAWADAILDLTKTLHKRTQEAKQLSAQLMKDYTMEHFAKGVVAAADPKYTGRMTKQVAEGTVLPLG